MPGRPWLIRWRSGVDPTGEWTDRPSLADKEDQLKMAKAVESDDGLAEKSAEALETNSDEASEKKS